MFIPCNNVSTMECVRMGNIAGTRSTVAPSDSNRNTRNISIRSIVLDVRKCIVLVIASVRVHGNAIDNDITNASNR